MIRLIVRFPLFSSLLAVLTFSIAVEFAFWAIHGRQMKSDLVDGTSFPIAEGPDDFGSVGDFGFVERSGKSVTQDTLRGKVWIAACFFTCCTDSCPKLSAAMTRLQGELGTEPAVRLVSITVDPTRDTTETLSRYAKAYNADADRWLFLTGSEEAVRRFVRERLKLAAEPNTAPDTTDGSRVLHSPKLTLIDKHGHINGYFDGTDPVAVGRLKLAAERLAGEAP
ncbi:MAG TPA: SCO family protein [Gemmataceae bacterium]|jgi:protein SCO1/2|nr:SCO family protein [Gemmataceae bacterium]